MGTEIRSRVAEDVPHDGTRSEGKMAAKSKKTKVEATEVETPTQAVPAKTADFIAFVTAEKVPALLDKKYSSR